MPFIKASLGDAQEQSAVPEGEYNLRCIKVVDGMTKGEGGKPKRQMTTVTIKVEDPAYPAASLINAYLITPLANDDPETKNLMNLNVARFLTLFGVPFDESGYNSDDINGATARCLVKQRVVNEGEANEFVANELVLPRLKTD